MPKIVLLSGHICAGKSHVAKNLVAHHGFQLVKTSDVLRDIARSRRVREGRIELQQLGDELDTASSGQWVRDAVAEILRDRPDQDIVVDAVRISAQIDQFRALFGPLVVHVHLWASATTLRRRFENRKANGREVDRTITYEQANINKTEREVDRLNREADLAVNTDFSDPNDTYIRVSSRLGLFAPLRGAFVDVVIGGQYGSEGKGQIAAYLAQEYDVLVRVGGPNAGHSVRSASGEYVYHQLPSGCRDTNALVLIGPGAVLHPEKLVQEIKDCGLGPDRVVIDPQAMTISTEDIEVEASTVVRDISSTGTGTGRALARKILERGAMSTTLARDNSALRPYVGETFDHLERAFANGKRVMLEGTQGSGLSLHHGAYPHVTSRDTNVAGCLSEAGIAPERVNHVIMVVRTYPIRVADPKDNPTGTSGRLKQEIDFATIAARAGLDAAQVEGAEVTSTTKRKRRVGEFEWDQFRRACALNCPTDIALTFVDYLSVDNRSARRYEQLTPETIQWIEEIERVAHAPASLISTRFSERAIIDRRNWV